MRSPGAEQPVAHVALLATGRSTFYEEEGRALHRRAVALLRELGAEVRGPGDLVEFAAQVPADFRPEPSEVGVLLCATFADASVAEAAFGEARAPVLLWAVRDPAPIGDRLHLNSLCGANLAAHALVRRGVAVRLLYGDPNEAIVQDTLRWILAHNASRDGPDDQQQPLDQPEPGPMATADQEKRTEAARAALAELAARAIGVIGNAPAGFTTCEYDADWLKDRLGLTVRSLGLEAAFERIRAVPDDERRRQVAAAAAETSSLLALNEDQVDRFGAATAALQGWVREARVDAVALRCWPEFPITFGLCPCSALGRLAGAGIPTACEADVNGAVTMLLLNALRSRDVYLADVVRVAESQNLVTFWHCGLAPLSLAADPARACQDVHCNRGIGVAGNFALRPGRLTIARLSWSGGRHRLFLAGGEGVPGPNRYKGNSLDVRLDGDAMHAVRTLVESGFEHHVILAWAELRPELRAVAALLDLEVIEPGRSDAPGPDQRSRLAG
jgi:L-fucose isomerase-like protein